MKVKFFISRRRKVEYQCLPPYCFESHRRPLPTAFGVDYADAIELVARLLWGVKETAFGQWLSLVPYFTRHFANWKLPNIRWFHLRR